MFRRRRTSQLCDVRQGKSGFGHVRTLPRDLDATQEGWKGGARERRVEVGGGGEESVVRRATENPEFS